MFVTYSKTTKILFFANTSLSRSSVVSKFTCPGCSCSFIGETERTSQERMEEHAYPTIRATTQLQVMKICQLAPIIVPYWTCPVLVIMMLNLTNVTLTR